STIIRTLLRTLSHDLSNTTQVVLASAEFIDENASPEKVKKNVIRISNAARSQAEIIRNAKESYLVRGGGIIKVGPVDLANCIKRVVDNFELSLKHKNVTITTEIEDRNLVVVAEKVSLMFQVLTNLIGNAIKFSHSGKVIQLRAAIAGDSVELCVQDEGIGMPGHILDRLFDENERVNRPGTEGEPGTGEGLLIVRDFVSAFGGTMKIESTVGKGTTIKIWFRRFRF
ncbi:MAG: HAMP domain-containing sensor histidine kinase, partial [Bdellovibrionota bacterium]